jgi:CheY-like chemotaxis protein
MQVATSSIKPSLKGRRVLIVEDEYFVADDIARALEKLGAVVVGPLASRDEALALFASQTPIDVAVLGINLRGEAIYPLADALRRRGVPFVFTTGYAEASVPEAYRSIQRWEKPFDADKLVEALPELAKN